MLSTLLQAIVFAKDKDIKKLEAKIFSLQTRAMAVEDENKSLKLAMKIVMQENETEISSKGENDDCRESCCQVSPIERVGSTQMNLRLYWCSFKTDASPLRTRQEQKFKEAKLPTKHGTQLSSPEPSFTLKNLRGHKMSKVNQVKISTFSGSTTKDMCDHVKSILRKKPDRLIIHVGTNSLRESTSPTACAKGIIELARSAN